MTAVVVSIGSVDDLLQRLELDSAALPRPQGLSLVMRIELHAKALLCHRYDSETHMLSRE